MSRARTDTKLFRSSSTSVGKAGKKAGVGASSPLPASKDCQETAQQVDADLTRALKKIFEVRNCKLNNNENTNIIINNNNNNNNKSSNSNNSNNSNNNNNNSNSSIRSEEACLTLFGKKLSSPSSTSSQDGAESNAKSAVTVNLYSRGSDKLPPAATAHLLKELHKQRLKQKGITATANDFPELGEIEFVHTEKRPEVSTLPLLNSLQEKRPHEDLPDCSHECAEPKRQRVERDQGLDLSLSMVALPDSRLTTRDDNNSTTAKLMEIAEKGSGASVKNPEQLTLFYNGQVLVYDDVPSDKAKAIMVLASSISSKTSCYSSPSATPATSATPAKLPPVNSIYPLVRKAPADRERVTNDVSQARKASLQKFLEKRKDRLNPKPVTLTEKDDGSSKSPSKERPRSRSPSPTITKKNSSSATPPRTPSRCGPGGADDHQLQKQLLEKCGAAALPCAEIQPALTTVAGSSTTASATTTTTTTRQWIGV